ncbi:ATP-binding protein [Streptomyces sp. NPDC002262]|uniref:ATP-binding protein n=1 Tax=Streptomyces sp. NPDC002262 TaxID=3154414 RepID=UPI00332634BC
MTTQVRTPLTARPLTPAPSVWHLPPTDTAATSARRTLRTQLAVWHLEPLIDDAQVVVSELVTNAVRHGNGIIRMGLQLIALDDGSEHLLLEVHDQGRGLDPERLRQHAPCGLAEGGRGLELVSHIAAAWGDAPAADGHTTWVCLALTQTTAGEPASHAWPACTVNAQPGAPALERDAHAS